MFYSIPFFQFLQQQKNKQQQQQQIKWTVYTPGSKNQNKE